jgi:TRAP-type uncharacterized transport system fused permease subunit
MGLLLQAPLTDVVMSTGTAVVGILALGAGLGGWIRKTANTVERVLATTGDCCSFIQDHCQISPDLCWDSGRADIARTRSRMAFD